MQRHLLCSLLAVTLGCNAEDGSPGVSNGSGGSDAAGGSAGRSGTAGSGGSGGAPAAGAGGNTGGSAGVESSAGTGGAGGGGSPSEGGTGGASGLAAAAPLQGFNLQVKCGAEANQMRSCNYLPPGDANCGAGAIRTYAESKVTMGGVAGTFYDVKLRFRGIIEANQYAGGTSPDSDGFYIGGDVSNQNGLDGGPQYSQYALEVSSPKTVYHLNHLDQGAQRDKFMGVHHFGFIIDYEKTIKIEGGASLSLLGKDNDCFMGRNCAPPSDDFGKCPIQSLPNLPEVPQGAAGLDGNFIWLDVVSVVPAP